MLWCLILFTVNKKKAWNLKTTNGSFVEFKTTAVQGDASIGCDTVNMFDQNDHGSYLSVDVREEESN